MARRETVKETMERAREQWKNHGWQCKGSPRDTRKEYTGASGGVYREYECTQCLYHAAIRRAEREH